MAGSQTTIGWKRAICQHMRKLHSEKDYWQGFVWPRAAAAHPEAGRSFQRSAQVPFRPRRQPFRQVGIRLHV